MRVLSLPAPPQGHATLLNDPADDAHAPAEAVAPVGGGEERALENSVLARVARQAERGLSLEEALSLLEAWSPVEEKQHPRWPKNTPGGLGGKFMKTGQRFLHGGVEYDVAFTAPGGLYAHVATRGHTKAAKLVWIPTKDVDDEGHAVLKGATRPAPDIPGGYMSGKGATSSAITATVIDPYVQHDHDPKIPLPANAPQTLTAERWQRFGRADQLRYVDLMHQFGAWQDNKAQQLVDSELAKQPHDAVAFLMQAYASQFGQSTSWTIGLLQSLKKWAGVKPTPAQLAAMEKDRAHYEQLKRAQDSAARAIQWDIYNRLASPDVAVFHKSGDSKQTWESKRLSGNEPVFSGLSMAQRYKSGGFGHTAVATPLAIRQIAMATWSADVYKGHGFTGLESENEVSVPEPMRFDHRTLVFADDELSPAQRAYLNQITMTGIDGTVIDALRANIDQGVPLPSLPEPAHIQMVGGGAKWLPPPPQATKGIGKLAYAELDADGNPVAKPANMLELQPGDYIEGMQGTRYIIVADPADQFGIRYYKVTDQGSAVGGGKFAGHQEFSGVEAYAFEGAGVKPFKKLSGHYSLPSLASQADTGFVASAWAQSGDKKSVGDMEVGTKFYANGIAYEKTGALAGHVSAIKSLNTGQMGQINNGYQTPYLKVKAGYTAEGVPAFDESAFFEGKAGKLSALGLAVGDVFMGGSSGKVVWKVSAVDEETHAVSVVQIAGPKPGIVNSLALELYGRKLTPKPVGWTPPQPGDTLAYQGKKGTVTKLLKGGEVQVNLAPGVVKLKPDDPVFAGLFSGANHTLGPKAKLKDMAPGQKFHGGTGGKIRPYALVSLEGSKAKIRNLDTGEESVVSKQRSFALLLSAHESAPEPDATPGLPLGEVFNPAAWKPTETTVPVHQLKVGDKFYPGDGSGSLWEVMADKGAAWEAKKLDNGAVFPITKSSVEVTLAEHSNVMPAVAWDPAQYAEGKPTKLGDMKVGDIFKGTKGGKHYLITKTGAKSGLSAVDLSNGNKSGPWTYDKVAPIMKPKLAGGPIDKAKLKAGDPVLLSQLLKGEQFVVGGQLHEVVEPVTGDKEKNATVASVLPGGGLGFPDKVGWYPGLAVSFHANVADAQASKVDAATHAMAKTAISESLSYLEPGQFGFGPYSPKSKTGGGYVFAKAKFAQEGSVLEDKGGHQYKVKVAGADPVVSDGEANWKISGEHNLKVVDAQFDDHAPDLGVIAKDPATAQAALKPSGAWAKNDAGLTLADLQPGDQFSSADPSTSSDSPVWEKTAGDAGSWKLVKSTSATVAAGATGVSTPSYVPGFVKAAAPAFEHGKMKMADMPPGTKFLKGGDVYTVLGKTTVAGHEMIHATSSGGDNVQYPLTSPTASASYDLVDEVLVDAQGKSVKPLPGEKKIKDLEVGDQFVSPEYKDGPMLFQVTEKTATGVTFLDVSSGKPPHGVPHTHVFDSPGHEGMKLGDQLVAVKAKEAHPLDSFGSWKDGVKVGDLKPGDQFAMGSGDTYMIGEVLGPPTANGVPYKIAAAGPKTTYNLGDEDTIAATTVPDWYKIVGQQGYTMADLAVPSESKEDYAETGTSMKLMNVPPGQFVKTAGGNVFKVLGTKHSSATQGSADLLNVETGDVLDGVSGEEIGAVVEHAPGFSASSFNPEAWEHGPVVPMTSLKPGDKFVSLANFDPHYYELASDKGGVMHFKGLGPMDADYDATPSGDVTTLVPVGTAAPAHAVGYDLSEFADNSLVKLSLSMLKPGQLYQSPNGNVWMWHGKTPHSPADGYGELVSADALGKAAPGKVSYVGPGFVPAKVGPVVKFTPDGWGPTGEKKLLSQAVPGDVFKLAGGGGVVKVLETKWEGAGPSAISVVHANPDTGKLQGVESTPYSLPLTPGTQIELLQPVEGGDAYGAWTSTTHATETDEYLVQALVDAWHKGDENDYFEAENAIVGHLTDTGVFEQFAWEMGADAENAQKFDDYVKHVIADRQIMAPGGGVPFGGGEPGAPGGAPSSDAAVATLVVGDEFEDSAGDKWAVVVKDADGVLAEPIGGEGDHAPFLNHEKVHVLTKAAGPPTEVPTVQAFLTGAKIGDHVWYDGGDGPKKYVVNHVDPGATGKVFLTGGTSYSDEMLDKGTVVYFERPDAPAMAETGNTTVPMSPEGWSPYSAKSKTGGGYTFADLGDLEPGAHFTDKSGAVYVVIGKAPGSKFFTTFHPLAAPGSGVVHKALSGSRVKLVG